MSNAGASEFADLFRLNRLAGGCFRGLVHQHGFGRIFGGLVLGQALTAAYATVDNRFCHSLHAYFLRPGDLSVPVTYEVENPRDGRSFSSRRIGALQHGHYILQMNASFQVPEQGCEHQRTVPEFQAPQRTNAAARSPSSFEPFASLVDLELIRGPAETARRTWWARTVGKLEADIPLQQAALAYVSDMAFMEAAMAPHGLAYGQRGFQGASLDHALWFHAAPDLNDWILFDQESPRASQARGLVRGELFSKDGRHIASAAQECLMRVR